MFQALVIDDECSLREQISANLRAYLGADIIYRPNAEEALALLKLLPEVDIIITRARCGDERTDDLLFDHISSNGLITPLFVLGKTQIEDELVKSFPEPVKWEEIIKQSALSLGVSPKDMAHRIKPSYCAIPIEYFKVLDRTNVNIYLKVKDQEKFRFIKKFPSSSYIAPETIQDFKNKNLKYLHIEKDDLDIFLNYACSRLSEMLSYEDMGLERMITVLENSYSILNYQVSQFGYKSSSSLIFTPMVDLVTYSMNHCRGIKDLWTPLKKGVYRPGYLLFHLGTYFSYEVMRKIDWGTQYLHTALIQAFLFSDLSLTQPHFSMIGDEQEIEKSNLSMEDKRKVLFHAARSAELSRNEDDCMEGVEDLIRHHHSTDDGIGFKVIAPKSYSPLYDVVMLCQIFSYQILKDDLRGMENAVEICNKLPLSESQKKILNILYELIQK